MTAIASEPRKGMGTQPWAVEEGADHTLRLFWSEVPP